MPKAAKWRITFVIHGFAVRRRVLSRKEAAVKFQTQGLVIREKAVGERGWFVTLLTRDSGLIQAFVNRTRGKRENRIPGTDLLGYSRLDLYKGRDKYIISGAVPLGKFYSLRKDLESMALAMYFCQLAGDLIVTGEDTGESLRLLLNALYFLDEGKRVPKLLKAIVEMRLLADTGYLPDLVACSQCGAGEAERMYFRVGEGQLRCERCQTQDGGASAVLTPNALRGMRHIVYSELEKVFSFNLTGRALEELSAAAEAYTLYVLGEMPEALAFYHSVSG